MELAEEANVTAKREARKKVKDKLMRAVLSGNTNDIITLAEKARQVGLLTPFQAVNLIREARRTRYGTINPKALMMLKKLA